MTYCIRGSKIAKRIENHNIGHYLIVGRKYYKAYKYHI